MAMLSVSGVAMPDPSELQYEVQGVSASDAGRAESLRMYTGKKGEVKKFTISWNNITPSEANRILTYMRPASYITITIVDPEATTNDMTSELSNQVFYVSDISLPFRQWFIGGKRYSKLSLSIIERK